MDKERIEPIGDLEIVEHDGHDPEMGGEEIFLDDVPPPETFVGDPIALAREESASYLGRLLVWFFGVALGLIITMGFALIVVGMNSGGPPAAGGLIKDAFVPAVIAASDFLVKVFGPLLGFVLGYYFGTHHGKTATTVTSDTRRSRRRQREQPPPLPKKEPRTGERT